MGLIYDSNFNISFAGTLSILGVLPYGNDNFYEINIEDNIIEDTSSPYSGFQMRCYYPSLILSKDKSLNKKVINELIPAFEKKPDSFYDKQDDDYFSYRFVIYDLMTSIISSSYRYIEKVSDVFVKIIIILIVISIVFTLLFSLISIKSNLYEISVLKARGCSNLKLIILFGFESILLLLISTLLSIPFSYLLVNRIDLIFTGSLVGGITFFKFSILGTLISFGISFSILLISIFFPLFMLYKKQPFELIKKSR